MIQENAMTPHKCPECCGRGWMLPCGFFSGLTATTSTAAEPCLLCSGTGILWSEDGAKLDDAAKEKEK